MDFLTPFERRKEAKRLALELLAKHGLHDWGFGFNRRKRGMGLCRFDDRFIELSIYFVDRNSREEIVDTILHEIAHALVGVGHGHDAVWKAKCVEVGAKPERCGEADMPVGAWKSTCGVCAKVYSRHRRPKTLTGYHCRACGPDRGKLKWSLGG